jgi:hypothetical protein
MPPPSVAKFVIFYVLLCTVAGERAYCQIKADHATPGDNVSGANWSTNTPAVEAPSLRRVLWPEHLRHTDPADPYRHVGIGKPLATTSWRNRPFHVGWLYGGLLGDSLVEGQIEQDDNMFGGYRLGWDFDHYWGTELRFGFAHVSLIDPQATAPLLTARDHFWDLSLLYYPWGDAHWRPFASVGLGVGGFRFQDVNGQLVDDILYSVPLGAGVKYYYRPWLALRTSVVDNWSFGSGSLATMHNVSLTAGVEVHFGGPRVSYYPFHPGGIVW